MRLVVPVDGSQLQLVDGLTPGARKAMAVPREVADKAMQTGMLHQLTADGEIVKGKLVRGGYKDFYAGPPADVYCLVI
jgi:hypothetical protein